MPSSLAYTRKFIILKKEFSTMAGNPKGHCKLEIKGLRGIVTVSIENSEADNFYNVLFISNDKLHSVWDLGKIFTDDLGRGKSEFTFIQKDLEARNFPMGKISGILIMRGGEVLLGGYLDKEDGTLERYIESMPLKTKVESIPKETPQEVEVKEVEAPPVNEVEETVEEKEVEEVVEEIVIPMEEDGIPEEVEVEPLHDPIYDIPPKDPLHDVQFNEEVHPEYNTPAYDSIYHMPAMEPEYNIPATEPIVEEQNIIEEPEVELVLREEVIEEAIEEKIMEADIDLDEDSEEPDYKTLDYIRKLNQKNQTTSYVLSILRFFPYIDPFRYELKGYNWWKVELDKENEYRAFLPYFSYIVGGNNKESYNGNIATCNDLMNKYEHYLFGLYNEGDAVKYFVYGIPGRFTMDEHPYRGANGFNTWYPGKFIEGYWIIYIDPMTGKPVRPVTPMTPVD